MTFPARQPDMLVAMAAIFMTILGLGIAFLVASGSVRAVMGRDGFLILSA